MYCYFVEIKRTQGFSTSLLNNKVDTIVNGIIEFKNGIQFRGIWNFNASEKEIKDECKIYGEKGTITFSFYGEKVFLSTDKQEEVFSFKNPIHAQQPMIEHTVRYFLGQDVNPCSIKNGVCVMKILDSFTA